MESGFVSFQLTVVMQYIFLIYYATDLRQYTESRIAASYWLLC